MKTITFNVTGDEWEFIYDGGEDKKIHTTGSMADCDFLSEEELLLQLIINSFKAIKEYENNKV